MMNQVEISLIPLIFFFFLKFCISIDNITPTQPIKDGDVIVSSGQLFALGFFSPGHSARRYVGIWYNNIPERTIIWVANRDNPVNGTSGIVTIETRGNLVIYKNNRTDIPHWSTNINAKTTSSKAQLLDSGNLVLLDQDNGHQITWESFDHPTDTIVPTMKLGLNRKTGKNWSISSWKSRDDPGTTNIVLKINPVGHPQVFIYNGSVPLWRGGPWMGQRWSGVPKSLFLYSTFVNNEDEVSVAYSFVDSNYASQSFTRKMLNEEGILHNSWWNNDRWVPIWSGPNDPCDKYGQCGANSNCYPSGSGNFICKCLPGFVPKLGSSGCIRKTNVSTCQGLDGFLKLMAVKLPDTSVAARVDMNMDLKACEEECSKNCSCTAYTSADESGSGCLSWFGDLIDMIYNSSEGQDLYLKVDAAELGNPMKSRGRTNVRRTALVIVSAAVISFLSIFGLFCLIKKRRKDRDQRRRRKYLLTFKRESESGNVDDNEGGIPDLPFFDLHVVAAATDNFSDHNKLGKGGFGSVYKGVLHGGKEIAVKRLSQNSGQGSEEFKNEVALIAKLQHRNLVKMLGYCIHDQEKMLIYEFLPNKSLDTFIFDRARGALLNWPMRHEIICGIARGILYLHQDSRLRIIHRDLKASNILLDASMKPKISDFGMARIFGANQIEAETHRVVGTYGYMAPEYAMQGQFSVKSDVYSFGILLLEIISGRKNSSFYNEIRFCNLPGHVWELWKEGRAMEIVDETLGEPNPQKEIERCIQIGLLCVQESAIDRPTMSVVVLMLSNDTILASPKQPAFILGSTYNTTADPSTSSGGTNSINSMTETMLHPR